jgi:hypothetical protein
VRAPATVGQRLCAASSEHAPDEERSIVVGSEPVFESVPVSELGSGEHEEEASSVARARLSLPPSLARSGHRPLARHATLNVIALHPPPILRPSSSSSIWTDRAMDPATERALRLGHLAQLKALKTDASAPPPPKTEDRHASPAWIQTATSQVMNQIQAAQAIGACASDFSTLFVAEGSAQALMHRMRPC